MDAMSYLFLGAVLGACFGASGVLIWFLNRGYRVAADREFDCPVCRGVHQVHFRQEEGYLLMEYWCQDKRWSAGVDGRWFLSVPWRYTDE